MVCGLWTIVLISDSYALEWPWQKTKKEHPQGGFTSKQVEERAEASRNRLQHQPLLGQNGAVVHSGLNSTYVDIYDESGVATRLDLDRNHDGKVRSDDFLLVTSPGGSKTEENAPSLIKIPPGFVKENFWEQLYAGRIQEESALAAKEINTRKAEIEQIEQNLLPGIDKTERLLMQDLLGFQDKIEEIEEQLLRFGVAISKTEDGAEQVQIPEKLSQVSTVKKFLLERRQLTIQTAKIKDLIEIQEVYRSKALRRKRELEKEVQELAARQSELERERSEFRP